MKLDTISLVETPEGTDLHAELVGVVPRALAYSIDFLLRAVALMLLSWVLLLLGRTGQGVLMICFFTLEWFYPVYFEVFRNGQTIGKKAFGIRVVNDDLTPVRFGASMIRNLLRAADFFPVLYFSGALAMLTGQRFQRLGDMAASTIVVYQAEDSWDRSALDQQTAIRSDVDLDEVQQAAFVRFALCHDVLSDERQQEIAEIIRPKIPSRYTSATEYVRGVGNWLLGAK